MGNRWNKVPVMAALLVGGAAGVAQSAAKPWQTLQMPSAAEVRSRWMSPPPEYGPEPYYGLNGPATIATVQHDLDTMRQLGFQAVTVQYGFGSTMPYLSPEYFAFFQQFVAEAKKRNMRVWIVDDAGYPSGFAGGRFTAEHPELRMQALISTKSMIAGGAVFEQAASVDTVAITAVRGGDVVQLPLAEGRARWTAPDGGDWTIYVVEHAFRTSPTRSDTNPKRTKDGSQSLEDYLDPAATAQYLHFTHDAYAKAVGDEFGKTILGFRGDEPDYSLNGLPWTPGMFARFQQEKGYDVRPFVALFLQGRDAVLTERQLRARADYYDVFANMFRDGFFKPQSEWCAAHGLEYQVHLNHEEMQIQLAHSEGDFFRDMRFVQVPGVDSIWHQIWTDTVSDFPRFASSAAHVYGHPRAFTESFAAYRPEPDVTMARYILDEQFVRGINLVETMYYPATSTPGRGGPAKYMQDPAFPKLTEYVRRMSYLMSMGRPAAQVALLLPAESLWMGDTQADDMFISAERLLSERQVDFDIVDEDAIGSLLKTEAGAFVSLSGNKYRTVIVPQARLLPRDVVARLRAFASHGGHVLFLSAAPGYVGGKNDLEAIAAGPAEFAWGSVVDAKLDPVPTPPAQPPASAPAPMNYPESVLEALASAGPESSLRLETPDRAIRFAHRELKDASVFLVFNESDREVTNAVTLQAKGGRVEIWSPQDGSVTAAPDAKRRGGSMLVPIVLRAHATQVIVVR